MPWMPAVLPDEFANITMDDDMFANSVTDWPSSGRGPYESMAKDLLLVSRTFRESIGP